MHTFKGLVEEPKQVTSSFCKLKEENSEMSGVYILAFYIEMKKNPNTKQIVSSATKVAQPAKTKL